MVHNQLVLAYRNDQGKPWVLPVVRRVELSMAQDDALNKEYLPITGLNGMCSAAIAVLLGSDNKLIKEKKVLPSRFFQLIGFIIGLCVSNAWWDGCCLLGVAIP